MGRTLGRQNPYFVLVNVIVNVIVIVIVIVIVMRMSIGTNPRVAEPVLGAALGISSTFRTWTPASVVNVCWVRPSEKFWLEVDWDPRSSGFKKGPRKRSLSPEWRCWAGSPSCACPKTACVGALGQQESDALQEITVEKIKWSQIHGIRV